MGVGGKGVELNTYGGGWRQGGGKMATGWGKDGDRVREGGNGGVCGRGGGGVEEEVGEDGDMRCQIQSKDYRDF